MLDIKFIKENVDKVKESVKNRRLEVDIDKLLALDSRRRELIESSETLKAEQNKKSKGPQDEKANNESKELKERIKVLEEELRAVLAEFDALMLQVPNISSDDTPIGPDESANKTIREVGTIKSFNFKPKEHWELGEELGILDTERAAKVSGSRFAYLKGGLAMIEFALTQYVISILTDEKTIKKIIKKAGLNLKSTPFVPVIPPVFIRPDVFQKMGRLEPKEERYYIPSDDLYLIGSAEHTLGSMHMDETLQEKELPKRYIGFSTSFRREAGSYGKDTKGMIRVHQFDKLEMETFSLPEDSLSEQNLMVAIQEYIVQSLELPYRIVAICTGDMGAPDARQIDIETWMPGQNKYRETHTSDLMTDFQSRRLGIKVKKGDKPTFVHMNDATAVAMSRMPAAIIENYQTEKGTIIVPKVLRPYMNGLKEIKPNI